MTWTLLRLAGISGGVVVIDQWTKLWATRTLEYQQPLEVLGSVLRLTYTRNSGVAFGLGAGLPIPYYLFSIAAVLVILYLFLRQRVSGLGRQVALALILGGAIGNLVDRLAMGEVVDFIEVGYGRWHWPVFNVADSAVTAGVVLFAVTWPRAGRATAGDGAAQAGARGTGAAAAGGARAAGGSGNPADEHEPGAESFGRERRRG